MVDPIRIWEYDKSPEELRVSNNGGDEDFLILVPPEQEVPWKLQQLGCCGNDCFFVNDNGEVLFIRPEGVFTRPDGTKNDEGVFLATGYKAPNYKRYLIVITSHA